MKGMNRTKKSQLRLVTGRMPSTRYTMGAAK
jgi:hypothetical protein